METESRPPAPPAAKPVVFLDYTGLLLPFIRKLAARRDLQIVANNSEPVATDPACVVVSGVGSEFLDQLQEHARVELHLK